MIYFTSDTHFGHSNIVRGTSSWTDKSRCRNFDTVDEHDEYILNQINSIVKIDDTLYHLGDWNFGGIDNIWKYRKQINCKNIHLILGNHDHHIERNSRITIIGDTDLDIMTNLNIYPHDRLGSKAIVSIRDLFTTVNHYTELKYDRNIFVLSHFAMRVWNKSHRGSIMLYGHSHGSLPDYVTPETEMHGLSAIKFRTMDIGVDTNYLYKPYSITDIMSLMNNRPVLQIDHHDINTN